MSLDVTRISTPFALGTPQLRRLVVAWLLPTRTTVPAALPPPSAAPRGTPTAPGWPDDAPGEPSREPIRLRIGSVFDSPRIEHRWPRIVLG